MAREKYKLIIKTDPVDSSKGESLSSLLSAMGSAVGWAAAVGNFVAQMPSIGISPVLTAIAAKLDAEHLALCAALEIEPGKPHKVYDELSVDEIHIRAAAARALKQAIGAGPGGDLTEIDRLINILFVEEAKRGPKERTEQEMADQVVDFIASGIRTQKIYRDLKLISKHELNASIKWVRTHFDYFRVISDIEPAMMKRVERYLRVR